jgi:Family of unknown function (DUF5670)
MLWALALIELLLWTYGMATGHRLGGFLHWLLVLAALAIITELGLRWRREWNARHTSTQRAQRAEQKKAA